MFWRRLFVALKEGGGGMMPAADMGWWWSAEWAFEKGLGNDILLCLYSRVFISSRCVEIPTYPRLS